MQNALKYKTLIELFYHTASKSELSQKNLLEIVRSEGSESLTFGRLWNQSRSFALHLIEQHSVKPKDKIAILGKNQAEWDIALWGTILASAVPVLIDPERPVQGVFNLLKIIQPRLLIMAGDYQEHRSRQNLSVLALRSGCRTVGMRAFEKLPPANKEIMVILEKTSKTVNSYDTAVILCTSGTTGEPREVELTHKNLLANVEGTLQTVKVTEKDILGHIIPPHHSFGFTVTKLLPIRLGATNIYTTKYRQIHEIIRDRNITVFIGIPALFTALARKLEDKLNRQKGKSRLIKAADRYFPGIIAKRIIKKLGWQKLRFCISGAAPVPKWVLHIFWKRGIKLYEGYGTTENSPVFGFNTSPRKLGSVGKPISTLKVKISNENRRALNQNQKGEIILGGPCIMKGYYKNSEATKKVIATDKSGIRWLHTGDLGYLDKDGYLFITGRKKYIIVLPGGKNVNPEMLELVLSQAPLVEEILVVPGIDNTSKKPDQRAFKAIVRPAWDKIKTATNLPQVHLIKKPDILKELIWECIKEHQQKTQLLTPYERITRHRLEIQIEEFRKTSTGKIKREQYVKL